MSKNWDPYLNDLKGQTPRYFFQAMAGLASLKSDSFALDVGAGSGNETLDMLSRGARVVALDSSSTSLKMIRERAKKEAPDKKANLTTILSTVESVQLLTNEFDFIYAGFSLPFVPKSASLKVWAKLARALASGGDLAVEVLGNKDDWAPDRTMTFFTKRSLVMLLNRIGLSILNINEHEYEDEHGKHWHVFQAHAFKPRNLL